MSSILKALRKLEEEKAATRDGGLDIGRDILRASGRRPALSWPLPAAILGAVLLVGWGVYQFAVPSAPVALMAPATRAPAPASAPVPPAQTPVSLLPPRPIAPPAPLNLSPRTVVAEPPVVEETMANEEPASFPAAVRSRPSAKPLAAVVPMPAPLPKAVAVPTAPPAAAIAPAPVAVPVVPPATVATPAIVAAPAVVAAPPAAAPPGPALLLSGIAYHDDPEARLAVINDLPVMIGTFIESAVVEEILRDRVRLSRDGKSFEIRLQK